MNRVDDRFFRFVDSPDALHEFSTKDLPGLDGEVIGLDIEEDREYGYRPRVSLIQITCGDRDYVLDPLALGISESVAVVEALCLTPALIVMHGCNNDITGLKRDFGVGPSAMYDTQIAARFAGEERFGLSNLLQQYFDVALNKSVRRSNWRKRPLSDELLQYAREDTVWLLPLREALHAKAVGDGWQDAMQEENDLLSQLPSENNDFEPWGWRRLKGTSVLDAAGFGRLHALWAWRDELGAQYDQLPGRLMPNWMLLQLSERGASAVDSLVNRSGPELRRHAGGLRQLLGDAPRLSREELERPDGGGRKKRALSSIVPGPAQQRFDALEKWRDDTAAGLGLEAAWLAPRSMLDGLARLTETSDSAIRRVEGMRAWRFRRYRDEWLAILSRFPL
jgi:ribonuclease D